MVHKSKSPPLVDVNKILSPFGESTASASSTPCNVISSNGVSVPLLFRVVTQQYGQGIVQYGNTTQTTFPGDGNGGSFKNICDPTGCIYLEVDLSCPVCATCGTTLDGYTGTTLSEISQDTAFTAVYRRYKNLEFEDKIGEVSFSYRNSY